MARVSFTLRRSDSDPDLGSILRWDDDLGADRTNYDSALRADGFQIAPEEFTESFFDVTSVCYGEVSLSWGVDISPTVGEAPTVTGIVVVYSPLGEPQTIASGDILVEASDTFSYEHTGLVEGRWAYYSLFLHYESSGGDSYYERAASLAVIVPKNYGSNLMLWKRIPEYYRIQDTLLGDSNFSPCLGNVPPGNVVGPLFKYLSVIGFEMDRARTMIDYQMVSFDPDLANTEHLDALGQQMAVGMRESDLGGKRLRTLMNDVGFFRRSKGTLLGTEFFGKSISGSVVEIDQDAGEITVYSQRVNYITSPKNGAGITTHRPAFYSEQFSPDPFEGGSGLFPAEDLWPSTSLFPEEDTTLGGYNTYTVVGSSFTPNGSGASVGLTSVLFHLDSPVPVKLGDRICFSVQSNVGTNGIKWARLVDSEGNEIGFENVSSTVGGSPAFEIVAVDNAELDTFTNSYIEYLVNLDEAGTFTNELLLAERNYLGTYFDGDTVRGGWLIDASSVSDYRWSGSDNASPSIFAEDYERTKAIVNELLFDVLPITEASKYTIVSYNAIPGLP